jgi:hypothetical protein
MINNYVNENKAVFQVNARETAFSCRALNENEPEAKFEVSANGIYYVS